MHSYLHLKVFEIAKPSFSILTTSMGPITFIMLYIFIQFKITPSVHPVSETFLALLHPFFLSDWLSPVNGTFNQQLGGA